MPLDKASIASYQVAPRDLHVLAKRGLSALRTQWRRSKHIHPFAISWPDDPSQGSRGERVDNACCVDLPEDKASWRAKLRELVVATRSRGVLLVSQQEGAVRALLETRDGTSCWRMPIRDQGGSLVLGRAVLTRNTESLGLLYRSDGS